MKSDDKKNDEPRDPSLILSEIQALSKRIVHERNRAWKGQFRSVNDALVIQRLERERHRLRLELPPLRLV